MFAVSWTPEHSKINSSVCSGPLPKNDSVQSLVSLINCPQNPTSAVPQDDITVRGLDSDGAQHSVKVTEETDFISMSGLGLTTISLSILQTTLLSRSLRELSIAANSLEIIDLTPLSACPLLSVVSLNSNLMTSLDLTPLASCSKLERLWLHDNRLESINLAPLNKCTSLRSLYLEDNSLHNNSLDLTPLSSTPNLRSLRLGGNRLASKLDLTPLMQCPALAVFTVDSSVCLCADGDSSQARISPAMRRIVLDIKFSGVQTPSAPRSTKTRSKAPVSPTRSRKREPPVSNIAYCSPPKPLTSSGATKPPPSIPIVKVLLVGFRRLARYAAEDSFAKCGKVMIRASDKEVAVTQPALLLDSHLILLYAPTEHALRQITVAVGRIPTVVIGTERYRSTITNDIPDLLRRFVFFVDPMDVADTEAVYVMGRHYATGNTYTPGSLPRSVENPPPSSIPDSGSPVSDEEVQEKSGRTLVKMQMRKSHSESSLLSAGVTNIELEDIEDDDEHKPNSAVTSIHPSSFQRSLSADGIKENTTGGPDVTHRPAMTWSEITRRLKERRSKKVGKGWGGYLGSEMSTHGKNKLKAERSAVEIAFKDVGGYATLDSFAPIARSCGLPKCAGPLLFKAAFGSSFEIESTTPEAGVPNTPPERKARRISTNTFLSYWDARLTAYDGEERLCNILEDSYFCSVSTQGEQCGHSPYGAPLPRCRSGVLDSMACTSLDLGPSANSLQIAEERSGSFDDLVRHRSSSSIPSDISCPCDAGIETLITAFMDGRSSRFGCFALVKKSEAIAIGSALVMYGIRSRSKNAVGGRARPVCPKEVRDCKLNAALIAAEVGIFEGVASGLSMDQIRSVKGCFATEASAEQVARSSGLALNYYLSVEDVQRYCIARKALLPCAVERTMTAHCRNGRQMSLAEFAVFLAVLTNITSNGAVDYLFTVVDVDQDERWTLPDLRHFHKGKEQLWLDDGMAVSDLVDIWVNLIDMIRPSKPSKGISKREFMRMAAKERKQVIQSLLFVDDDHSLLNIRRTLELSKQSSLAAMM